MSKYTLGAKLFCFGLFLAGVASAVTLAMVVQF